MPGRRTSLRVMLVGGLYIAMVAGCASTTEHPHESSDTDLAAEHEPTMEEMGMSQYFVGFLYRGPAWTPEVTDEVTRLQEGHMANIGRMAEEGTLILAGPFGDDTDLRGLFFFDVETMEEAERLCQSDPAVQAGRLRIELHPWWGSSALKHLEHDSD